MLRPWALPRAIDAQYLRTLRKAVRIAGGEAQLARALVVPEATVRTWLAGEILPPVDFYMAALDFIEQANLNGERCKTADSL